MRASVGDRLVLHGHRIGPPTRHSQVLEMRAPDGGPPYLVRWGDSGHEALFFPGSDAFVRHYDDKN